jgi:hypothetical protein
MSPSKADAKCVPPDKPVACPLCESSVLPTDFHPAMSIGIHMKPGLHQVPGCVGQALTSPEERELLLSLTPKEGVFIEIGTFHGATAGWLAERRPRVTFFCIDTFGSGEDKRFWGNSGLWIKNRRPNMHLFVGTATQFASYVRGARASVVFVDGQHAPMKPVLDDLYAAWSLSLEGSETLVCHDFKRRARVQQAVARFCETTPFSLVQSLGRTVVLKIRAEE